VSGEGKPQGKEAADAHPKLDFATFVLSLSHSALVHLGEAPHPDGDPPKKDLALARQTIDMLGMLEEKTRGNLTGDEERMLSQILYDLRMRFLELSKAESQGKKA
jgi:hypothetical protein